MSVPRMGAGLALLGGASRRAVDHVRGWPVRAQQAARRNAMVAATACAARRAEHADVEAYLETREALPGPSPDVATDAATDAATGEPMAPVAPEPAAEAHADVR